MGQLLAFALVVSVAALLVWRGEQTRNHDRDNATAAIAANRALILELSHESAQREDQFCLLAERDHRQKVRSLRQTYRYLLDLNAQELGEPLNQLVLRNLPQTEADGRKDQAPELCDRPGKFGNKNVGLPEPDPVIPKRPKEIDALLR